MRNLAVMLVPVLMTLARAETITIQGTGSTFVAPLHAKWIDAYNSNHPDVRIEYTPIGSGGGIKAILERALPFAGSDAPLTDGQLQEAPGKILHVPTVSGPLVMIYNLPGIKDLQLSGPVIADIYLGKITHWNDAKIAELNSGMKLPETEIAVTHRSDGSGTTWIFTNYLNKVSSDWQSKYRFGTSVKWPTGVGGKGNAGVAQNVQMTEGAIGYVELAFAVGQKLTYATLINKAGKPVQASIESVYAAQTHALTEFPADMRVSITNADGDDSYPICGFTYLLVYQDLTYLKDKEVALQLVKFVEWCVTDGHVMAKDLKYAKLSPETQKLVVEKVHSIVFDGKPLLKQ